MNSSPSGAAVRRLATKVRYAGYYATYRMFKGYTMIPVVTYIQNLRLANHFRDIEGCVVECGTWRGGMAGGIARHCE